MSEQLDRQPALDNWTLIRDVGVFQFKLVVDGLRDFGGIRIEDDVLVTRAGCKVLSKDVPKNPDEISALMASGFH